MENLLIEASSAWNLKLKKRERVPTKYAPKASLFLVENNNQLYVLKTVHHGYFTHPTTSPEEYSKGIGFFVDSLTEAEIPLVKYLPTTEGRHHHQISGSWYVLYPYVEAVPFRERDEEIANTARVHAKMNTVLAESKVIK